MAQTPPGVRSDASWSGISVSTPRRTPPCPLHADIIGISGWEEAGLFPVKGDSRDNGNSLLQNTSPTQVPVLGIFLLDLFFLF